MKGQVDLSLDRIAYFLSLIEKYIPTRAKFQYYQVSDDFNSNDTISLQKEARRMMEFVGLYGYTTVISMCKTAEGTAGNINLNLNKDVFIEVSEKSRNNPHGDDIVLGVMAHEICHKLLYTHGLYLPVEIENEFCTDIATFYVGFGRLTLNGCYVKINSQKEELNGTIQTTTSKRTQGYLTPSTYFIVHMMVCKINGISTSNLDEIKLNQFEFSVSQEIVNRINKVKPTRDQIKQALIEDSCVLARRKRNIILLRAILDNLESCMHNYYYDINGRYNEALIRLSNNDEKSYWYFAVLLDRLNKTKCEEIEIDKSIEACISKYANIERIDQQTLSVRCPFCGSISPSPLREHERSIRKCKCGKIFYWDASSIQRHSKPSVIQIIRNYFSLFFKKYGNTDS